jgi:Holliday junction resolvase
MMQKLKDRKRSEAEITKEIRVYLKIKGVWHYKQWQGLGSLHGIADIIGIYGGQYLAIEVKREGGKLSDKQYFFLQRVRKLGGLAFVARSLEDVDNGLAGEGKLE